MRKYNDHSRWSTLSKPKKIKRLLVFVDSRAIKRGATQHKKSRVPESKMKQ